MTTALKIIERAFSKAQIRTAETPLSDSEINDGRDTLNDMLALWDATGVLKGVPPVDDVNTDLQEPRAATLMIKSNLAIRIVSEYGIQVGQGLALEATSSLSEWITSSIDLTQTEFPSTLPIGSGNRDEYGYGFDRDFFPENTNRNF